MPAQADPEGALIQIKATAAGTCALCGHTLSEATVTIDRVLDLLEPALLYTTAAMLLANVALLFHG